MDSLGKDIQEKTVPIFTKLEDIYQNIGNSIKEKHEVRYQRLKEIFQKAYGQQPKFFCRAPGRVNIIGEHIDYCGYSVLPAAIEQDFIMAYCAVGDGKEGSDEITISNIDKDLYPTQTISTDPYQKMKEDAHWINYFLCGYKSILAHNESIRSLVKKPVGLKIMIDSHVPAASGLSSSSAFTVCAAVTTMHANNITDQVPLSLLAELTITAERMAGTACGGMDQTISIMGEKGTAKLIDFVPSIKTTTVKIPDSVCLVIGNSCTPSPKLLTLGTRYNKRVVECRFALSAMAIQAGKSESFLDCPYKTFEQLQSDLKYSFDEMLDLASMSFQSKEEYTPQKISKEFNVSDPFDLVGDVPHILEVKSQNASFELYKRAFHVLSEAKRVLDFKSTCENENLGEEEKVQKLGKLMNESHMSCKIYYDCSSEQLDELTQLARKSGALGSRLTGAGWGGCCVSLVKKEDLKDFIDKIYEYFTKQREPGYELWITDDLDRYIFASTASQGACVIDPQYTIWFM